VKESKELEAKCIALAGGKPARKHRPAKKLPAGWAVELTLPTVVRSEANQRCHWAVRKRRFDTQNLALRAVIGEAGMCEWLDGMGLRVRQGESVVVTWTHIGRRMDSDNLAGSMKALRDELAKWLAVDDGDERITWVYRQEQGSTPGVRVRIEGGA
jgi:hypothetical protein